MKRSENRKKKNNQTTQVSQLCVMSDKTGDKIKWISVMKKGDGAIKKVNAGIQEERVMQHGIQLMIKLQETGGTTIRKLVRKRSEDVLWDIQQTMEWDSYRKVVILGHLARYSESFWWVTQKIQLMDGTLRK